MGIISLKRSMDLLAEVDRLDYQASTLAVRLLGACAHATEALAEDDLGRSLTESIRELCDRLSCKGSVRDLAKADLEIGDDYSDWADALAATLRAKEREFKRIVSIVAEAAAKTATVGTLRSVELHKFADQIDATSRLGDIMHVRKELARHVKAMQETASSMEEEAQEQANGLKRELSALQKRLEIAEVLVSTDALTGLGNRRMAESTLAEAISSAGRVCVLMIDLDDFKYVNDKFGHLQGDQVLKLFASDLRASVRPGDVVCRYGGDEFVVIFPNADIATATKVAERIRERSFGPVVLTSGESQACVTLRGSMGISEYHPGESPEEVLNRADASMYREKQQRRSA